MGNLKLFNSDQFGQVRTVKQNNDVYFGATDIAKCLGYSNPQKAIIDHCKSDGVTFCEVIDSMGRKQKMKFITKGNVIRLVTCSNLPQAEKVESWIFDEVIPTVLETGGYISTKQDDTPEEIMARALVVAQATLAKREERLRQIEERSKQQQNQIENLLPKATFVDKIIDTGGKIDMGQAAKLLKLPFGRNKLFEELRKTGIFFKNRNEPKQTYIDSGYFELREQFIERKDHPGFTVIKVLVTQRGLEFLNRTFNGEKSDGKMMKLA